MTTMSDHQNEKQSNAVLSECGRYRYTIERSWAICPNYLMLVMLNPSTADAEKNDPTIRCCIDFAKLMGYTGILVGRPEAWVIDRSSYDVR